MTKKTKSTRPTDTKSDINSNNSDIYKLVPPNTLANINQMQETLKTFSTVHADTFRQIAEMQQAIRKSYTLPMLQFSESIKEIVSFQNSIAEMASIYQNTIANMVINSGITQLANTIKSIKVDAFAGLRITSELLDTFRTEQNGIITISKVKESKMLANANVQIDFEKDIQTSVKSEVVFQKIDNIETKVTLLDENLLTTKEDTQIIRRMLENERDLLQILQNNPFPYFKILSIKFYPQKSLFRVNDEIIIQVPQYSMMENLCTILFSGEQQLGEEWYEDSIQESWITLVDIEQGQRITWKQILTTVNQLNTLFAKKTTKDDLIIIERPKRIRLNPRYFIS